MLLLFVARRPSHQVGADPATPITGPEADVTLAAYYAAEVAAKTIKAGNTNTQVQQSSETVQAGSGRE